MALGFFSGDYNPHFFQWPSLFFYIAHGVARAAYVVSRVLGLYPDLRTFLDSVHADPAWFFISLRTVSALAGVLTIVVVYRLGRAAFGRATALLGAFFLSLAYLHVRDSHFGVLDVTLTLLIVLTAGVLIAAPEEIGDARRRFVLAGICAGLATSIKYNAAAVIIIAVAVAVMRVRGRAERVRTAAMHLALFSIAFGVCFVAGSPYVVLDARSFAAGVQEQGTHFTGGHGFRIGNGWLHHLTFSLRHGLGLPLLAASLAGGVAAMRTAPRTAIPLASFPLVYFAIVGAGQTAFVRYVLPLVPFLCIFAGFAVDRLVRLALPDRLAGWRASAGAGVAALVVLPATVNVVRFDTVLARTDTRVLAADWLREHMAPGAVLYEAGASYAQPHVAWPRAKRDYMLVEFDAARDRFTTPGAGLPDWIVAIADSSPRLYSRMPYQVTSLLGSRYELVQEFSAVRGRERESWFDRQDAFFLPYSNLTLRERPGPELRIYRRAR